jgi:hypothetical protein
MSDTAAMKLGIYLSAQHPADDDPARRFAVVTAATSTGGADRRTR